VRYLYIKRNVEKALGALHSLVARHLSKNSVLKSHTKTPKILPFMFRSPMKPSSGGTWPYFATLMYWNIDLHLFKRMSVCGCMSVHLVGVCVHIWSRPDWYPHIFTVG
jgi:hypothetical protein